jgi:MoaA/NifB/PqqE/SkfB family radical SAM enzyme
MDWPRTRQIIERSHRRGIFTLVSTNSTLTTPAVAEEVVASGLDYIVCAIDGVSQASYQTYRVGGEVEQALDGMRLLVEERRRQRSRLTIEWQFLVHKHNEHEFDEARRIADQLGVFLRFSPLRGMEFHDDLQREWLPSAPEYAVAHQHTGDVVNDFACYFLWRSMVLSSSGTLVRCPIYENTSPYATVLEGSMLDGFNGASTRRARELFARGPVAEGEFPSPCATCSFFERHHGGPNLDKFGSVGRGNKPAETGLIPVDAIQRRTRQNALRRERSSS